MKSRLVIGAVAVDDANVVSLPHLKFDGISPSHSATDFHQPDAKDWARFMAELSVLQDLALLAYTNTAPSAVITNTNVETAFSLVKDLTLNVLKPGDFIKVTARGIILSENGTDTLAIKLYFGTVVIATIAAAAPTTNNEFMIEADIFLNAAGSIQCKTRQVPYMAPGNMTITEKLLVAGAEAFSTNALIKLTATWSAISVNDQVQLTQLSIDVKRGVDN